MNGDVHVQTLLVLVRRGQYVDVNIPTFTYGFAICKICYLVNKFVCGYCTACANNMFRCESNGLCIPTCQLCDGYSQCGDYSDETNCAQNNSTYFIL